jgi:60S ribosome subunit biogenesis protein NIP7
MRPLTDVETQTLFTKLANYTGRSLNQLIAPSEDGKEGERHVFRLHESRVYYVRLALANLATAVARDNLLSLGTCVGKFTKTGKFRLHITALDVIAPHARYKLWIKQNGEMPFLYGGHVVKAHVGRWSEDCPEHSGVVILSMDDTPLGFGVTARSTAEARKLDPTTIVAFRQGDVGEYLREVSRVCLLKIQYVALIFSRRIHCSLHDRGRQMHTTLLQRSVRRVGPVSEEIYAGNKFSGFEQ